MCVCGYVSSFCHVSLCYNMIVDFVVLPYDLVFCQMIVLEHKLQSAPLLLMNRDSTIG